MVISDDFKDDKTTGFAPNNWTGSNNVASAKFGLCIYPTIKWKLTAIRKNPNNPVPIYYGDSQINVTDTEQL